jgi:hypothetical protein
VVRTQLRKLVLVLLGTLAGVAGVVVAIRAVTGSWMLSGCAMSGPLGWTLPIATGFVIAAVGWLLLSQKPHDRDERGAGLRGVSCPACSRSVLTDWRLCPYCGAVLVPGADAGGASASRV